MSRLGEPYDWQIAQHQNLNCKSFNGGVLSALHGSHTGVPLGHPESITGAVPAKAEWRKLQEEEATAITSAAKPDGYANRVEAFRTP
jgi:hypothetical protein